MERFYFLLITALLLLSSSMASSFVPSSPLLGHQHAVRTRRAPFVIRGGSSMDEETALPSANQTKVESMTETAENTVVPAVLSTTTTSTTPEAEPTPVSPRPLPEPESAIAPTPYLGPKAPPPGLCRSRFPNLPWRRLPNLLCYARLIAIPLLMGIFYQPGRHVETASLFILASFTDFLDGYLARRWDITSAFGAFLDPVADKLMVSTCLILLAGRYGAKVAIPASVILAREIAVSALREWMAQRGLRDAVQVGMQGKIKTALTMVSLSLLLLAPADASLGPLGHLQTPGIFLIYLCAVITVTSGSVYFRAAAPVLLKDDE